MSTVLKLVRFSAVSWWSVLSAILVVTLILGPFTFAGDAHAADHHASSSVSHEDHPAQDDHSDVGDALTHCGSPSCAPSNVGASTSALAATLASIGLKLSVGDDALLRSLYLDCDPPVPRGALS